MIKGRIHPEDVIINCSKDSKWPQPPKGHTWKEIRHDNSVETQPFRSISSRKNLTFNLRSHGLPLGPKTFKIQLNMSCWTPLRSSRGKKIWKNTRRRGPSCGISWILCFKQKQSIYLLISKTIKRKNWKDSRGLYGWLQIKRNESSTTCCCTLLYWQTSP